MRRLLGRAAPAAAVVAVLALASCDSGKGDGTPADLSPAAKAKWDDYCAARVACLAGSMCPPSTCIAGYAEEAPLLEFLDCQNAKACGANDDDCTAAAGTTDTERQAFTTRCEAAISGGQAPPGCYIEPVLCTIIAYPLYRKQYLRAVDACLPRACEDRKRCIEAALAPLGCN
jgi:hypothetical protein